MVRFWFHSYLFSNSKETGASIAMISSELKCAYLSTISNRLFPIFRISEIFSNVILFDAKILIGQLIAIVRIVIIDTFRDIFLRIRFVSRASLIRIAMENLLTPKPVLP